MLWLTWSLRQPNRSISNYKPPHRAPPLFWKPRLRHGSCERTHTRNPPWLNWCGYAPSSWPTRVDSSSSALLMRRRLSRRATRSYNRECTSRVLFPATVEQRASWDRRHRHHLDGHELRIRDPADRFSDRPISGGFSWRRFA